MDCWRSPSTCRAAARGLLAGPALAQLGHHRRRRAPAGLHDPRRADPRRGRSAGHGGHPGRVLLRAGRAAARRAGGCPAVDNAVAWVLEKGYRNVLLEINNECNVRYDHAILQPARVHELIARAKRITRGGRGLLVSTSYGATRCRRGGAHASDFVLLHGNGVSNPDRIAEMVRQTRQIAGYTPSPSSSTRTIITTSRSRGTTSSRQPASARRGGSSTSGARARRSTRAIKACR